MDKPKPDTLASDMRRMMPYWRLVSAMLEGLDGIKKQAADFLPRMPDESARRYELRLSLARFTNVFDDVVENLSARPFSKKLTLAENAPQALQDFVEDVDGRGNHLHVFAAEIFHNSVAKALDWVLVDYTADVPANLSRRDEAALGARPYWIRYSALDVLAAYTETVNGREEFIHVRLRENATMRDGFDESTVERVRVIDREEIAPGVYASPTWQVWEKVREKGTATEEWRPLADPAPMTISRIPLVAFVAGRRLGQSWVIRPPMKNAADLQRTMVQQETALEFAKHMTAYPMIAGQGITPDYGEDGEPKTIQVGPGKVLYAPHSGEGSNPRWELLEPDATSLRFLADDVETTAREIRELGRQPLTSQSGNLTRITTAFAAAKGNAAIQAWALNHKDALEMALSLTSEWLKLGEVDATVVLDIDFDLTMREDDGFEHVLSMRGSGDISREATLHEAKRRSILDKDFDQDEDSELLLEDLEDAPDPPPRPADSGTQVPTATQQPQDTRP